MAAGKEIRGKIKSVENTKKITKAMEMVAAAKLKRFQSLKQQAAPYQEALEGILDRLLKTDVPLTHPLLEQRREKASALLCITSDTGLCGSYNHSLVAAAKKFLGSRTDKPLLIGFGKNGVNALSRSGHAWHTTFKDIKASQLESAITDTGALLESLFNEKKVDAVHVIYSHFTSKTGFAPTLEQLLPFQVGQTSAAETSSSSYIMEPGPGALFTRLVPLYFATKIRMILLESLIAEQMARRSAMSQATENAEELIETLILLRNKMRQAAITKELIEIVSGSKALKQ